MSEQQASVMFESAGTPQRWRVLAATFIAYLYDSFDLVILAIAMPVLIRILNISMAEGGLLVSVTMIGAAIGSMTIGVVAENHGRRFAVLLSLFGFGIGTGLIYVISSWGEWMVLRFFTGVAIGGVWGPCVALISIHWAPRYRSRAAAFMLSTFALGALVASFVGRLVLSLDWRLLFLVGTTSILVAFYVWWAVPNDSPKKSANTAANQVRDKIKLASIFKGDTGRRVLLATALNAFTVGGFWGSATWIPTFLTKVRGLSLTTMANFSVVMYIGMFIGYQFYGYLGDRIGRKKSIMWGFINCAIALPIYLVIENGMFLFWWGLVVGLGLGGPLGVVGAFFAELFPERIRALAGGFCFNVSRIGAVIAPFTVGALGQRYGLKVGIALDSILYISGLAMLLLLPETAKLSMKEPSKAMSASR